MYIIHKYFEALNINSSTKYQEKHAIIVLQATPNNQPGGVQGALFKLKYQSDVGPLSISQTPKAKPPKLMTKNSMRYWIFFIKH